MTARKTRMPSIKDVAAALRRRKPRKGDCQDEFGNEGMDIRLQVYPDGNWAIRTGDSSYDLDHRGYWGAGFITPSTNCRELAKDLIGEADEHAAMCGE